MTVRPFFFGSLPFFHSQTVSHTHTSLQRQQWMRTILPIGALFSGSLILSNYAYLTLSVSFIQMLKAFNPVAILLISFAFKIQEPNGRLIIIVLVSVFFPPPLILSCGMIADGTFFFCLFRKQLISCGCFLGKSPLFPVFSQSHPSILLLFPSTCTNQKKKKKQRPMVKFNLSSLASSANALLSHSKLPVSS